MTISIYPSRPYTHPLNVPVTEIHVHRSGRLMQIRSIKCTILFRDYHMMCCWQSQENVLVHYVRCNACAWPWAQRPKINNTGQCACLKPHHRRFERIWFKSCADFALLFIMLPFGQLHQYSRHMSAAAAVAGPTTNDQKSKIARYFRSEITKHEEVHVVFSAHATSSIRSDYLHLYLFPSMGLEKLRTT